MVQGMRQGIAKSASKGTEISMQSRTAMAWGEEVLRRAGVLLVLAAAWAAGGAGSGGASEEERAWVEPARRTHARFSGQRGTFAQFGDSITVTAAFWTPLREERRNASAE